MRTHSRTLLTASAPLLLLGFGLFLLGGCKPAGKDTSQANKEPVITGKPTDAPAELTVRWRPGWRYQIFVQSSQTADLGFGRGRGPGGRPGGGGGADGGMETIMKQEYSVLVTNAARGAELAITLDSLGVTAFMGSETVLNYDSQQSSASAGDQQGMTDTLDKLVGGRFTVFLRTNGSIARVEGLQQLLESAAGGGQGPGGGGRRGFGGMMGGGMLIRMINDGYVRQLVEFQGLPHDPVRVGDTWTHRQEVPVPLLGNLLVETKHTFRGWQEREKHKCARIEITGTLSKAPGDAGGAGPMRWLGDLKVEDGHVQGTMWVDPELQFPVEISMEQSFNVAGTMPSFGARRGGGTNAPAAAGGEAFSRPVKSSTFFKLRSSEAP